MTYDIVVKGARIVDGTGKPEYPGDVAIRDGVIAEIGRVNDRATRTIDAVGQVVAPGFIDAHTHYDAQLLWDPTANPSTTHGITTILTGNCGYTLAPVRSDDQDYLMGLFAAAEEIPKQALAAVRAVRVGDVPRVPRLVARAHRRERTDPGRAQRGTALRDGRGRARTRGDRRRDRGDGRDLRGGDGPGAAGISSSQAPHQRGELGEHIPSFFADRAETRALAEAVRRKGKRLLSINPATKRDGLSDEDRALLVELAELSGAVVSWNDFGMGTPNGDSALEFMEAELQRGHKIFAVARCQRPETRFTLKKLSAIFANSEAWVELSRLDPADKLAALGDPEWRARLGEFWDTARFMVNTSVEKAASSATAPLEGRLLVDIAQERGMSPSEVMFDVARADKLETFFRISGPVNVDESRLERILQSPATLVGISDGGAHLQTFAGGDYTSYFLAHWVREKGSFSLEEGVAALTSRGRALPRHHRPRHARNREGGRPRGVRSRHDRTAHPADARRHPRRRDAHDEGGARHPVGARERPSGRRGRRGHDGGPGRGARHQLSPSPMARTLPVLRDWNRFYWSSGARRPVAVPALRRVRRVAAPTGAGVPRVRWRRARRAGRVGARHRAEPHHERAAVVGRLPAAVRRRGRRDRRGPARPADDQHRGLRARGGRRSACACGSCSSPSTTCGFRCSSRPASRAVALADEQAELERIRSVRPMARLEKFEDRVALTGIGMSRIGRKLMVPPVSLTVEAIRRAVDDAGPRDGRHRRSLHVPAPPRRRAGTRRAA